jgi:hypothetical protein
LKLLILGGYGVFCGRLAELLSDIASLDIVIAGRNLSRAGAFCAAWRGQARVRPLQLDRNHIAPILEAERPDLVVDASGPFQEYGANAYGVVEACIAAGIDYLDFADGADFVFGISQFDEAARNAGVFALSGVSSFPVLTAAVLREMARTMDIVSVAGGIAPSPYAGIGLNVMRAVVGYAGGPVKLWRDGGPAIATGLAESMRFTIAVPGKLPLDNIRFSLVAVPDLQVIPPEHPALRDIWMGAGPVPEILHRILNLLARMRATFGLPSLVPLSGLFYRILNLMKFGEHRGGMFVRARGMSGGMPVERSWHLLAEGDDGPYIPSMAIEAIIRKCLAGDRPQTGARPATHALDLADYDALFAGRTIHAGFRESGRSHVPPYREVLGYAFDMLPRPIRDLHELSGTRHWAGKAEVRRGDGVLAKIVTFLFGFPVAGADVPLRVTLAAEEGGERWTRAFAGKSFSSFQRVGRGRKDHLLLERFGPIEVALALIVEDQRLVLVPRRWTLSGIPLPRFLLPRGRSFEAVRDGRFAFDVEISAPMIGLIVAYRGELDPA